jgi:hypothetical protein
MSSFELGKWKAVCQRCGFDYKNTQLRLEWTGLRVCSGAGTNDCYEVRHPQDFVKGKEDRQAPPWVSPEPDEIDVSVGSGNEVSAEDL